MRLTEKSHRLYLNVKTHKVDASLQFQWLALNCCHLPLLSRY